MRWTARDTNFRLYISAGAANSRSQKGVSPTISQQRNQKEGNTRLHLDIGEEERRMGSCQKGPARNRASREMGAGAMTMMDRSRPFVGLAVSVKHVSFPV